MNPRIGIAQRKHTRQPRDAELAWQLQALCRGGEAEIFFPHKGTPAAARPAKRICIGCTVRADCLRYALAHNEVHGVWGGLSENERRELQRRRETA